MFSTIRRLRCRLRGFHDERCVVTLLLDIQLQEHVHACADCETTTLATIQSIPSIPAREMGNSIPDQQHTYMN